MPATVADLKARKETPLLVEIYVAETGDLGRDPDAYMDWRVAKMIEFCRVFGIGDRGLTDREFDDLEAWIVGSCVL